MPRVHFLPSGLTVDVPLGTTVFRAAVGAGLPVATACSEEGWCGRCALRVSGKISAETKAEATVKVDQRVEPELRLSCVTSILGDVEVTAEYW